MLASKTCVVMGAAGAIGSSVARRLSAEGARLYLAGHSEARLSELARELGAAFEVVDATDEEAVERFFARVAREGGGVDATFTAVGPRAAEVGYGQPVTALHQGDFLRTMAIVAGSQLTVARAAARHMVPRRAGSIVTLSASLSAQFVPFMSGITAACGAIEAMTRSLAAELGPAGVRVNCVRAGGMPSTRTIRETLAEIARTTGVVPSGGSSTLLGRPVTTDEVASLVAFVASSRASGVTGQVIDVCAGTVVSR